jgi:hypothetical protein
MRQRLLGTLAWSVLIPLAGLWRLLWLSLRFVVARFERVAVLGGLAVAFSVPNPLAAQLSAALASPEGRGVQSVVLVGGVIVVLWLGLRSRGLRRLRRLGRHRGWCW